MSEHKLELKDLVKQLRLDLQGASEAAEEGVVRFRVECIDLEVRVATKKAGEGEGGIKFYVVSLGASGKKEDEHTQTIRLRLVPESPTGGTFTVSGPTEGRPALPSER